MTKEYKGEFKFRSPISLERSLSPVLEKLSENAESIMDIRIHDNGKGGVSWSVPFLDLYEEIGLWFEGNKLVDYDGVFEIPEQLLKHLRKLGYNTSEI